MYELYYFLLLIKTKETFEMCVENTTGHEFMERLIWLSDDDKFYSL
jgi:hypothetical protein